MTVPNWWEALLVGLAVYRLWRLIAVDDILDRPRRYVLRLGNDWQKDGDPVPSDYRSGLADFITCPFCLGAWLSIGWWVLWLLFPTFAVFVAVPFAISAFAALVRSNLDAED